jgi:Uma2 family endonuclease
MLAAEAGSFESQRVELIEGEVIDMPAQNDPHAWAISRLMHALHVVFPDPYWIKVQATLRLNDYSAPEPDIAVMSGPPRPPAAEAPKPLLIVEVSETSLDYDLGPKASLYAANGIADYWVADVAARQVHVFRSPVYEESLLSTAQLSTTLGPAAWGFKQITVFKLHDRITPLAKPQGSVEISAFLG